MRRRASASVAGFSVLELLVSFALLLLATMIAGRLLLESQARMAHSARQALEPVAEIALEQIRADVRAAGSVPARDYQWNWRPMILLGHPVGTVRYERRGRDLVRRVIVQGDPEAGGERTVMREVTIWRWRVRREAPLQLIEIELSHREISRFGPLTGAGQREVQIPTSRSHVIAVSPRRGGGRSGW